MRHCFLPACVLTLASIGCCATNLVNCTTEVMLPMTSSSEVQFFPTVDEAMQEFPPLDGYSNTGIIVEREAESEKMAPALTFYTPNMPKTEAAYWEYHPRGGNTEFLVECEAESGKLAPPAHTTAPPGPFPN